MSQNSLNFWSQQTVPDLVETNKATAEVNSPCPVSPLPDICKKSASGLDAPADQIKRGAPRRSVAEMQLEVYNKGAWFLRFSEPDKAPDGTSPSHL